ncbi:MAG: HDOD domain-containing protein [Veillonellales bacterium]
MEQHEEVHVARQPIFDRSLNVFGYELLFRSNFINAYDGLDGDKATHSVITNSFLLISRETLTNGKKAFINFTANSIKNNIPSMLPENLVVVEILENVIPDEEIIAACRKLKHSGYILALDDFVFQPEYEPLLELADIIKVDFRITPPKERAELIQRLQSYSVKLLAEKVETFDEFKEALQMGYSYFQGYFFCKPVVVSGKTLPEYKANYLQILKELNQPQLDFSQLEAIIKRDVSLSYKLLKFINSALFGFKNPIHSLRQALILLGQKELTKWMSLITLNGIANHKPGELILESLIRARFAEMLAATFQLRQRMSDAFLMGLLSHIDALLDRPLQEILDELSLDEEIKQALLAKGHTPFSRLYQLILAYEKGDWTLYTAYAKEMQMDERKILNSYRESLVWAHDLIMYNE